MKRWTQTNLDPGNCWQTAVACVLEVDPTLLPAQHDHEWRDEYGKICGSYRNPLNAYLRIHHNLAYCELYPPQWRVIEKLVGSGIHMMTGPTVRTPQNGRNHVVVAHHGEMVWDPHPSHAGLTEVNTWGVLAPFPDEWMDTWKDVPCPCPTCTSPSV